MKVRAPYGPDHSFARQGGKFHLLIGITGSVASIKLSELITELRKNSPQEKLVCPCVVVYMTYFGFSKMLKRQNCVDRCYDWFM